MKIKSIFAATLAAVMACSTIVAYAANDFDTRTPDVKFTVGEKISAADDITKFFYGENALIEGTDEAKAAASDSSVSSARNAFTSKTAYDYYPLTIDITKIGELSVDMDSETAKVIQMLDAWITTDNAEIKLKAGMAKIAFAKADPNGAWIFGYDAKNNNKLNFHWDATKDPDLGINMYPLLTPAQTIKDPAIEGKFIIAVSNDTKVEYDTSTFGCNVVYYDYTEQQGPTRSATVSNDSFTIPAVTEPTDTPWAFTVTTDLEAKKTNGYIWDVTGTKGDGDLTSFVATFTDTAKTAEDEDYQLTKTIDGADLAALSNWNTAPAFAIGLKTDKAVTADFTATSTKDGKTIDATIAR